MSRNQVPQVDVTIAPKFLATFKDSDPDDETSVPTISLDSHDASRHYEISPDTVTLKDGLPYGVTKTKDAQKIHRPMSSSYNTFDDLFSRHKTAFNTYYVDSEDVYTVFRAWAYCQASRGLMPVRPIAIFTGAPGSTKTTTAEAVGQLWYGTKSTVTQPQRLSDTPRDFYALLEKSPFLLIDNVENADKWLHDTLCVVSSCHPISQRELYTTSNVRTVTPDTFLTLTTYSMLAVARSDVLARSLIFDLQTPAGYQSKANWTEAVESTRTPFWKDAIRVTQAVLKAYCYRSVIGRQHSITGDNTAQLGENALDRLQDFMWIGEAITAELEGVIGVKRFRRGMAEMVLARTMCALQDPEIECLVLIANRTPNSWSPWYSAAELVRQCGEATGSNYDWITRNSKTVSEWIAQARRKAQGTVLMQSHWDGRNEWRVKLNDAMLAARQVTDMPLDSDTLLDS